MGSFETHTKVFQQGEASAPMPAGPGGMMDKCGTCVCILGFMHNQTVKLKRQQSSQQALLHEAIWAVFLLALPHSHIAVKMTDASTGRVLLEFPKVCKGGMSTASE